MNLFSDTFDSYACEGDTLTAEHKRAETETEDRVMYTYQIKGQVNYNDAETEDGNLTIEINETVEIDELGAESALRAFFAENEQYDDFFDLKTCDQETYGKKGASFTDRTDNDRRLYVDLIE